MRPKRTRVGEGRERERERKLETRIICILDKQKELIEA